MAKAVKLFKNHVHYGGVRYEPGDEVPDDIVDNIDPNNFAEDEIDALGEDADAYKDMSQRELAQLAKDRELPAGGSKADIIGRLVADDQSGA